MAEPPDGPTIPSKITLPLLPLRDIVVFPSQVVTLFVGRDKSMKAVEEALSSGKLIFLSAQRKASVNDPVEADIHRVGTVATLAQVLRYPNETIRLKVQGVARARIGKFQKRRGCFMVRADLCHDEPHDPLRAEALVRTVRASFEEYARLNKKIDPGQANALHGVDDPGTISDIVAGNLGSAKLAERQGLLEQFDPIDRLDTVLKLIASEIEILQIQRRLRSKIRKQMDRDQKEYYLNVQKQMINKELGEGDEFQSELKEIEEKIAKKSLSEEAKTKSERELRKLKLMSPMSAESAVIRNWLDWVLSVPWNEPTQEHVSLNHAEQILDEDHYGLRKVKDRIIEYIAVQQLSGENRGPILCLVGPPGVGKTSMGRSVARSCGRRFTRVSLGGVRDEAEIRGHRRTYIGAFPGKIIHGMKRAGVSDPVFLLDEVDKMTVDFRGDPASALLEVLDPEQNNAFNDHFLDVDYDLSKVMFITTANTVEDIPIPLLDRMELIELPGYTDEEKMQIATRFLIPKQRKQAGLESVPVEMGEDAVRIILDQYTREPGVRNLEREIASVMRKITRRILEREEREDPPPIQVGRDMVTELLGVPRFHRPRPERRDQVGLAWGLAVTRHGGEILAVEVAVVPGKGKLMLTGKLGDVMQESAQAALSYVRSRAERLGIDPAFHQDHDIHVHLPEGAVPKDGPSAGITIAACLVSSLLKAPLSHRVAMTGEVTLRGRVLPIGGVKDKILAAARERIPSVILPRENRKDLKDIPRNVLQGMRIVIVDHVDDVLREVLVHERVEEIFPTSGTVLEYAADDPGAPDSTQEAEHEVGWELEKPD
jgi:ATP-dependent Lon protease